MAKIAYGTGSTGWRGDSSVKLVAPAARTAKSSQPLVPVKMPGPKSSVTVNSPLLTATAELVTDALTGLPLVRAL